MNNNLIFFLTTTPTFPEARCADEGVDAELFFPNSTEELNRDIEMLRKICDSCKHVVECAQYAIDNFEDHGIWGGTTPAQRERVWDQQGASRQRKKRVNALSLGHQSHNLRKQGWSWEAIASRLGTTVEYAERSAYRHRKKTGEVA